MQEEQPSSTNSDVVEELTTLTDTEELFCQCYARTLNGRVAYQEAIDSGVTNESASSMACVLRRKQKIRDRISQLIEERKQRLELDGGSVLHELMCLGFSDLSELCDAEGRLDPVKFKNAPPEVRRCVEGMEQTETIDANGKVTVKTKFKFVSKVRALELLGKNPALRLFVEQSEMAGKDGEPLSVNFTLNFVKPGDK